MNKNIIVYSKHECPNCEILEDLLNLNSIEYQRVNIATPAAMTEIAMHGVSPMFAPVLQICDNIYYKEMWKDHGKILNIEKIKNLIDDRKEWKSGFESSKECKDGVCVL